MKQNSVRQWKQPVKFTFPVQMTWRRFGPKRNELAGTVLGQYELLEGIGHGGMGTVYKARHRMLGRIVAVKVLAEHHTQNPRAIDRFMHEMKAIGKLDHPNIVRATDAGHEDNVHFLAMDYVEGCDLARLVRELGPLSVADACELARQAALGLQYIHDHGMIHRDIKPSNLLLDPTGQVKILDLGLSLLAEGTGDGNGPVTATGSLMGTYDYMSPEQCDNSHNVTIQSDLYSLGCTLYELLSGHTPFSGPEYGTPARKLSGHLHSDPSTIDSLRPEVPKPLVALVSRLLSKAPGKRFGTPEELAGALEPFAKGSNLQKLHQNERAARETSKDTGIGDTNQTAEYPHPHDDNADADRPEDSKGKRSPKTLPSAPRRRVPRVIFIAVAGVIGTVCIAASLLMLRTPQGTLLVQVDDPAIEAKVTAGVLSIKDTTGGRTYQVQPGPTRLPPGEYNLVVRDDAGLKVDTDEFTLRRGEEGGRASHPSQDLRAAHGSIGGQNRFRCAADGTE